MNAKKSIALVTGAGSGIGKAVAQSFLQDGSHVILLDKSLDGWDDSDTVSKFNIDVSDFNSLQSVFKEIAPTFPSINCAFNGAGIGGAFDKVHDYDVGDWKRVFSVNTDAVFYCMKLEIPLMLNERGGAIVNCASLLSVVGYEMDSAYVASKHAVVGLTKSAALEYAKSGIRINCVSPGFVNTPMTSAYDDVKRRALESKHAIDRFANPDEIAKAVKWLCSPEASFVCGHNMVVDGGYTIA